jgi:uncharacterized protein YbaR (Trm112 family)
MRLDTTLIKDLLKRTGQKLPPDVNLEREPKSSKYGNTAEWIDCPYTKQRLYFDSQRELGHWFQLCLMQRQGLIQNLRRQIPYILVETEEFKLTYVADFVYEEKGTTVVADSKGMITKEYAQKRKLMKSIHSITIKEM